jgi:hypothetical protein
VPVKEEDALQNWPLSSAYKNSKVQPYLYYIVHVPVNRKAPFRGKSARFLDKIVPKSRVLGHEEPGRLSPPKIRQLQQLEGVFPGVFRGRGEVRIRRKRFSPEALSGMLKGGIRCGTRKNPVSELAD